MGVKKSEVNFLLYFRFSCIHANLNIKASKIEKHTSKGLLITILNIGQCNFIGTFWYRIQSICPTVKIGFPELNFVALVMVEYNSSHSIA